MKTKKYTIVSSEGSVHQTDDPKVVEYAARFEMMPPEQKKLVMDKLRDTGLLALIEPGRVFLSTHAAVQALRDYSPLPLRERGGGEG